jgi:methylase of polypeptide subunit release factors
MGVTPSSVLLSNITIHRPVASALDLGTGAGVQALLAARHAEHIVATDISPRAIEFTRFNCRLNGVDNVR